MALHRKNDAMVKIESLVEGAGIRRTDAHGARRWGAPAIEATARAARGPLGPADRAYDRDQLSGGSPASSLATNFASRRARVSGLLAFRSW